MRIAYLVMAHEHPQNLGDLISQLDTDNVGFFVHVDRKVDITPFIKSAGGRKNVTFLNVRKSVAWAGYSMVEVELMLMREAVKGEYDYYKLLSGICFPIKSNREIFSLLEEHRGMEFIYYWGRAGGPSARRLNYYYFMDAIPHSPALKGDEYFRREENVLRYLAKTFLRKPLSTLYWLTFWAIFHKKNSFLRRYIPKRKYTLEVVPHCGDTWWCISHACAQYVLNFIEKNPKFVKFYRYVYAPEEMVVVTIVMNSHFASKVFGKIIHYNVFRLDRTALKKRASHETILFVRKCSPADVRFLKTNIDYD